MAVKLVYDSETANVAFNAKMKIVVANRQNVRVFSKLADGENRWKNLSSWGQ